MNLLQDLITDKALHRNLLKFATMLTVSKAVSLQDAKFMTSTIATLVGFTVYHLVTKKIQLPIINPDLKRVSETWMKVGTMMLVSRLYQGGKITNEFLTDASMTLIGFNVADIIVPRFLPTFQSKLVQNIVTDVAIVMISTVSKALLTKQRLSKELFMGAMWTLSGFILYDLIQELSCE